MQRITSCFAEAAQLFGPEVSLKKTEILRQPAPQVEYHPPSISIEQSQLKAVRQFSYLGCVIICYAKKDTEVDNTLAKANTAFGREYTCLEQHKDMKVNVYKAVMQTTLLYGAKSWVTYRCHLCLIEHYHQRCLRTILNIHWSDFITNIEVLDLAKVTSIEVMLLKTQLRWAGHV